MERMQKDERSSRQAINKNHKAEEKAIEDQLKEEERREKRERMKKMAEYKARKLQEKKIVMQGELV